MICFRNLGLTILIDLYYDYLLDLTFVGIPWINKFQALDQKVHASNLLRGSILTFQILIFHMRTLYVYYKRGKINFKEQIIRHLTLLIFLIRLVEHEVYFLYVLQLQHNCYVLYDIFFKHLLSQSIYVVVVSLSTLFSYVIFF